MKTITKLLSLCALLALSSAAQAALKLEGKPYAEARKIIVSYGWQCYSDVQYCSSNHPKDSCAATPELFWCRGAVNCEFAFHQGDRCLYVNVKGGSRWNSYKVTKVKFARGAKLCPRKD